MSSNIALEVKNLSKCYRVFANPRDRLLQSVLGERRKLYQESWALRDVSFQLGRGQTLGVVGRNGSGKSTLLQLICGTLAPSLGTISVQGRIAALLELGSGFNPEFSGIDNVYLNGALLGLSRKCVETRIDDILSFADIGDYVFQPVKTYSSGMALRLAFAVQAMLDPEVLIVDEALAVGDERFQKKCYAHLEKLRDQGTSILLVTHSCPTIVQQCDQALLLHQGQARLVGEPKVVTTVYQRMSGGAAAQWGEQLEKLARRLEDEAKNKELRSQDKERESKDSLQDSDMDHGGYDPDLVPASKVVYPDRGARIEDLEVISTSETTVNLIPQDNRFNVRLKCYAENDLKAIRINCFLTNASGIRISGQLWPPSPPFYEDIQAGEELELRFCFDARLAPGVYFITAGIKQQHSERYIHRIVDAVMIRVLGDSSRRTVGFVDLTAEKPTIKRGR